MLSANLLLLIVALEFAACAPKVVARQGAVVPAVTPQSDDQCRAQPFLDWCVAAAKARTHG